MVPGASYDVIVVGLGAVGAAAAWQLARSGARVFGIDQFHPPHSFGSSHGDTRITRQAVGEGANYLPLVRRSHTLWREIERLTGDSLLVATGGLVLGPSSNIGFRAATATVARQHGIDHTTLTAAELRARFPAFNVDDDDAGYHEPGAGYVRPGPAISAQLRLAVQHGATLEMGVRVIGWRASSDHVRVLTRDGEARAETLIIAAGSWVGALLPEQQERFAVYRQVLCWFDLTDDAAYEVHRRGPVFIWQTDPATGRGFYGFPAIDGPRGGVKVATEQYAQTSSPDAARPPVTPTETRHLFDTFVAGRLEGVAPRAVRAVSCLYTVTPDHHFVVDHHPETRRVIIASPCSGHGFKHSPAIGESLAQLATHGSSDLDLSRFGFSRFASRS